MPAALIGAATGVVGGIVNSIQAGAAAKAQSDEQQALASATSDKAQQQARQAGADANAAAVAANTSPQAQAANAAQQLQSQFAIQAGASNGLGNQSSVFNQLQGVANGTGPNPAQAQLAQATGDNVANQAALMAGQRGAGANAGLLARQAAQQGAATQQQAAGQAATLQANQSLGALNQLGGIAGQQVNQQLTAQQQAANTANSLYGQSSQNTLQGASLANNSANQALGVTGAANNLAAKNIAGTSAQAQETVQDSIGGVLSGGGTSLVKKAEGGMINSANSSNQSAIMKSNYKGSSFVGKHLHDEKHRYATGGSTEAVPALVSPGEKYLNPEEVRQVLSGKSPMQTGETIPGKPVVGGAKNSYENDTVPKTLETGGIVIPRSITQSEDASTKAKAFVDKILSKKKGK